MNTMHYRNDGALGAISDNITQFSVAFVLLFCITVAFLAVVGATPDGPTLPQHGMSSNVHEIVPADTSMPATTEASSAVVMSGELPVRVVAKSIGLDANVENPASADVDALDEALTLGAVRYPTSAVLGVNGTVLIFGHSSYLPVVYHQYYKTFDGIQNLKQGEMVSVYSGAAEYRYRVVGVKVADATQDVIDLPADGKHLTLVTCDSFSKKTNRFVVTADFVGMYTLGN